MNKPTKDEIEAEITALRAFEPYGRHKHKTAATIAVQIAALSGELDTTTDEFADLVDDIQLAAYDALLWVDGARVREPSKCYAGLVIDSEP